MGQKTRPPKTPESQKPTEPELDPESKNDSGKKPARPSPLNFQSIFALLTIVTFTKWIIEALNTQMFFNGYLIATLTLVICTIQSFFVKLPKKGKNPASSPVKNA